jgi:hypothetical protein
MAKQQVLISFKTMSTRKLEVFRESFKFLGNKLQWEKISSVYRVQRQAESFSSLRHIKSEEMLDGYSCVGIATTSCGPEEVMDLLREAEEHLRHEEMRRSLSCNLLAYGSEMLRFPELTLPHPEFHLRPEEVIPASEVWPEFIHPVLLVSIRDLARSFLNTNWGEYYCAGSPLLDRKESNTRPEDSKP